MVAVVAAFAAPVAHAFQRFPRGCARADFMSGGRSVRAELCRADAGAPAVVVLHGCGGFSTFDHRLAVELPTAGIATLDVDYFALTLRPGSKGFCNGGVRGGGDPFPVWMRIATDAARSLHGRGFGHVGVVGWSLGGAVALAVAEGPTHPFAAVAGFSTGGFGAAETRVRTLPPTILLTGGPHDAIPAAFTRELYDAIRSAGVTAAFFDYGHGSHNWPGKQGTVGIAQAAAFLHRHLG